MERGSRLQQELRQQLPFRSRTHEGVVSLAHTADRLGRYFATVITPHGVTTQQYNVLRILRGAGQQGLPTLEIAERMIESTPGITRLLDRLEAKHLVRRERCPEDRRQVLCWITPTSLELLARLDDPVSAADEAALRPLDATRLDSFLQMLDDIRVGLEQLPAAPLPIPRELNPKRRRVK
jgi:MarR family transcriptional regulator, organic hydroperoxide resistance regulator